MLLYTIIGSYIIQTANLRKIIVVKLYSPRKVQQSDICIYIYVYKLQQFASIFAVAPLGRVI